MTTWTRDWVWSVIKPFITQLKNRLGNIKLEQVSGVPVLKFTNAEGVQNNVQTNSVRYNETLILTPRDGIKQFYGNNTGYLFIELPPEVATTTMMKLNIDIYVYITNMSFSFTAAGYNYTTPYWYNVTAGRNQYKAVDSKYKKVRFARRTKAGGDTGNDADRTKFLLIIGNSDANWHYAKVAIMESIFSHGGATMTNWDTGWNIYVQDTIPDDVHIDYTKNM